MAALCVIAAFTAYALVSPHPVSQDAHLLPVPNMGTFKFAPSYPALTPSHVCHKPAFGLQRLAQILFVFRPCAACNDTL